MRLTSRLRWLIFLPLALMLTACGYNDFQSRDEAVAASWSEVLNQYQRRADLIPNLVATVQGYASHEAEVFKQVTDARSKIGSVAQPQTAPENPQTMQAFQQSQGELNGALSRLLAISERYPELKSDRLYSNLMVQLEGTENRIAVARQRYIKAIEQYNLLTRQFPSSLTAKWMGYQRKETFQPQNVEQISTPPAVDFSLPATQH